MFSRFKPLIAGVVLAAAIAAIAFSVDAYRHRFVRSNADMVALLPQGDWTTFFADFALLRRAGILQVLGSTKSSEDAEYRAFVRETEFDYQQDIQALAGATDGSQLFFIVRGSFAWNRLRQYAGGHGGGCGDEVCSLPTSRPGRWASFLPIQSNVIGLAVSTDRNAAYQLSPRRDKAHPFVPMQPVWVNVSHRLLEHPESLPPMARIFAISLAPADRVVFSMASNGNTDAPYTLQLDAECATSARANVVVGQLQMQTTLLRGELVREQVPVNPADLTGLLATGAFLQQGNRAVGKWPIYRQLLTSLQ